MTSDLSIDTLVGVYLETERLLNCKGVAIEFVVTLLQKRFVCTRRTAKYFVDAIRADQKKLRIRLKHNAHVASPKETTKTAQGWEILAAVRYLARASKANPLDIVEELGTEIWDYSTFCELKKSLAQ